LQIELLHGGRWMYMLQCSLTRLVDESTVRLTLS